MNTSSTVVCLFSRTPDHEAARKLGGLGLDTFGARRLARTLWCQSLEILDRLPAHVPVVLLTDGPLLPADRARLGPRPVRVLRQRGATFDQRLTDGLARAGRGFERLVVIGSDAPRLQTDDLRSALAADGRTWTIGGAVDGGVYLLGLPCRHLDRLQGLDWCTRHLHQQLLDRLHSQRIPVEHLTARADIDGRLDLVRAYRDLQRLCHRWLGCDLVAATAAAAAVFDLHPLRLLPSPAARPRPSRAPPLPV